MKPINDWDNVKSSDDYDTLPPGGYVCRIVSVEDRTSGQNLKIDYDIAEGDHKDHWRNDAAQNAEKKWRGTFYRSYKQSALGMFKGFTNAVEGSNSGYKWDWDEKKLVGKLIGLTIGDEEYAKNDGTVGTWPKVRNVKTVQDIRDGRFKIPQTKKLEGTKSADPAPAGFVTSDDDLPF